MPMPVPIMNEFGRATRENSSFRPGWQYKTSEITLVGEMPKADMYLMSGDSHCVNGDGDPISRFIPSFLYPNHSFLSFDSPKYVTMMTGLSEVVNHSINGPYYFQENCLDGSMYIPRIVLLDDTDIDTFRRLYPQWDHLRFARGRNLQLLGEQVEQGWNPTCPRLQKFMAELGIVAAAAPTAPAP